MNFKNYYKVVSAVALKYNKNIDLAPKIIASGKGELAKQIIAVAKKHNIPIKNDEELVNILELVEINSHIPIESYAIVANILSTIYNYDEKTG